MDKCVGAAIAIREHGATRFEDMTASFFCEERRSLFVLFVFPFPMPREVGNGIFICMFHHYLESGLASHPTK